MIKRIYLLLTISLLILTTSCSNSPYKATRILMGTLVEVTSFDEMADDIVFAEFERIEKLLSKYRPESDVWRLNKFAKAQVSPETIYLVKKAKEFSKKTNGAFDITVAPLITLWGFKDKKYAIPKRGELIDALKLIGSNKIAINQKRDIIELQEGMQIDLGAIAKGFSIDSAVAKLKDSGIKDALINAGGDIFCLGKKLSKAWSIAIRDPHKVGYTKKINLTNKAVATSGDYEQYFIAGGKRYAHIIDPRTGFPAQSGVTSVTVIADDCLTADAIATSIFILGKKEGERLAKKLNAEIADIIVK